jgi:deoxycytidylate deaminase
MSNKRIIQKIDAYFSIVDIISSLSNSSTLKVGCLSLKKDFSSIASFGYNGSYKNAPININTGTEEESLVPGKSEFIHSEINMAIKFREKDPENYIILLSYSPCKMCTKVLINSGFKYIYWLNEYRDKSHLYMFDNSGILYGDKNKLYEDYKKIINVE